MSRFLGALPPDGRRKVTMCGGLSCTTEVGQAKVRLGSRNVAEHATYLIEAVDAGIGGGKAGDSFAFTVFFDPKEAPLNYKIFGPKFTFTGQMVAGEISIIDPRQQNAGLVPRLANDTTYGLSAGIITGDPERGMALAERIQAGMVHVNDSSVHDEPHAPFGGIKGSGLGRHGGKAAIEAFTEQRWVSLQTERRHYAFDH